MSGLPTLADDSGLEVEVLDGKPGLHSNRIGTLSDATDGQRRKYLLSLLKNKPKPWKATFHCEIVFIGDEETIHNFHGSCHGLIIEEEKGQNGFGYDPIFYFPELNATMAELSESQKNQISHRANAVKAAIPLLSSFFNVDYR
jgi:XTP/dITP diphosphohydrolase